MYESENIQEKAIREASLGNIYLVEKNYSSAIEAYKKAIDLFSHINDLANLAITLRPLGSAYYGLKQFDDAEKTFLEALSLQVNNGSRREEASLLGEMGNLYHHWKKPENALKCYQQALEIFIEIGDDRHQSMTHQNLYRVFLGLKRLDNAHTEILCAIKKGEEFGHITKPWKTWEYLSLLEDEMGNKPAAIDAYRKAIEAYLNFRKDGGENHTKTGYLVKEISGFMQKKQMSKVNKTIDQCFKDWEKDKVFLRKLRNIIGGEARYTVDSNWIETLYNDLLWYDEVAELILLGSIVEASWKANIEWT